MRGMEGLGTEIDCIGTCLIFAIAWDGSTCGGHASVCLCVCCVLQNGREAMMGGGREGGNCHQQVVWTHSLPQIPANSPPQKLNMLKFLALRGSLTC